MESQLCAGSRVWCWVAREVRGQSCWVQGVVLRLLERGVSVKLHGSEDAVEMPDVLLANPDGASAEDMTTLTHLHEPGVLHNLDTRYGQDAIYTYTGTILIAVNPFKRISSLVAPEVMMQYQQHSVGAGQRQLAPHVYSTAVSAYKQMLQDRAGQAILITGESGAGKTETCKLIMRCLAHLGSHQGASEPTQGVDAGTQPSSSGTSGGGSSGSTGCGSSSSSVEQMVLESNPLLEAFGNAKTSRNDNSSRFGKYVEIQFDAYGSLQGAAIRTYLLERSRVVHVVPGERSFHAFYQLCAGASPEQRREWHLGQASDYAVLNQSECKRLVGVDDAHEFQVTCHAMSCVGLSQDQQHDVFALLAAILHLGNVRWADASSAAAAPPPAPLAALGAGGVADAPVPADAASWQALQWAADLLQVEGAQLLSCVSTRTRQTPDGPITSPLTPAGADEARNALCKVLYARLFAWLVACINGSLQRHRRAAATDAGPQCVTPAANGHGSRLANGAASPQAAANGGGGGTPTANGNGHANGNGVGYGHYAGGVAVGSANGSQGTPPGSHTRRATAPVVHMTTPPAKPPLHPTRTPATEEPAAAGAASGAAGGTEEQGAGLSIGLLDIYGFESFEVNDLEQLCINLANEKLQQHFNQHVFKWEQAEYTREGVDWRYIDFVDNQEVLDLVEGRMGLLDLLDEQCRFPTSTADDLAHKYASTPSVTASKRFEKLRRPPTAFAINHYAGPVRYHTDNFLEKNKDFVVAEHAVLMGSSSSDLVSTLFTDPAPQGAGSGTTPQHHGHSRSMGSSLRPQSAGGTPSGPPAASSANKSAFRFDSVASQFKRQLADLMAALHVMQPHYVRCIKPNPANQAGVFEPAYVLQQLRCGGVMEAVRISCAGFSYKRPYAAFLDYFWPLCPTALHALHGHDAMRHCRSEGDVLHATGQSLLQHINQSHLSRLPTEVLQQAAEQVLAAAGVTTHHMGVTKLFLKAAQAAALDRQRSVVLAAAATRIQAAWRGWLARREFERLKTAAMVVQAWVRGWLARLRVQRMRRERAAVRVQAAWRGHVARRWLQQCRQATTVMQAAWRARGPRMGLDGWRRERAAIVCQSFWRARAARMCHQQAIALHRAAVQVQAGWRGWAARQQYQRVLPQHRAAGRIQRAWRASRAGARLREAFRGVVLRVLEMARAAPIVQRAWRAKAARLQLERLRRLAQRQRFQQQLKMFECAAPAPAAPTPRARGPRPLLPYQLKLLNAGSGGETKTDATPRMDTQARGVAEQGQPVADTASHQQDTSPTPPTATQQQGPPGVPDGADKLRELRNYKIGSLMQLWQGREQTAAAAQQIGRAGSLGARTTAQHVGRQASLGASTHMGGRGEGGGSSGHVTGSGSTSTSPASPASFGQLLDLPPVGSSSVHT